MLSACVAPETAHATDGFYDNFYGTLQPPLALPQSPRATIRVPLDDADGRQRDPIDMLRNIFPAVAACWQAPEGLRSFERNEVTVRFALRRDGSVIGTPRITYSQSPAGARGRARLIEASLSAIRRCTPVQITPGLGGAIAGKPLSLRFVYEGPKGRGV